MFSSMIINTLGLPPSAWTAWAINLLFTIVGVVLLRNLIWLSWPKLRNSKTLRQAGFHLDLALVFSVMLSFLDSIPTQIAEFTQVLFLIRIFFVLLVLRQIDSAVSSALQSKELFPQLSKTARDRWQFVTRAYLIVWAVSAYGYTYLPMNLTNSWSFLVVVTLVCVALYPVVRDIVLGWSLIQSLRLSEGQMLQIKRDQNLVSGKITELKWTHLVLETTESAKTQIRWYEVYKAQVSNLG